MSPECKVFIAMSLDGYIATTDHGLEWLNTVAKEGEDYGFADFFSGIDTLLLGGGTYDAVRKFPQWPYAGKRCIVWTSRHFDAVANEEFFRGEIRQLIAHLQQTHAGRVYVDGGRTISAFLRAGEVSSLVISVIPILLGSGIPLFSGEHGTHRLRLQSCVSFDSGLVQLSYEPLRAVLKISNV